VEGLSSKILLVMAGGAVGALCRYGISVASVRLFGPGFFWGTFIANMIGCFLIGALFSLTDRWAALSPSVRLLLMTGFLGALTTFSTFALETVAAVKTGNLTAAFANVMANNAAGLLLVLSGMGFVELLFSGR
jgi:CrcB protein